MIRAWLASLALLATAASARAQPASIALSGPGGVTKAETLAEIEAMPAQRVHIAFEGSRGQEAADYEGAPLWEVLNRAGVIPPGSMKEHFRIVLRVTGRDGFSAALALAEIDPAFEAKPVLLAWQAEGAKLGPNQLRLVVPGDKHGARNVRDVVRIEVE